jgi:predicted transcriptional regulator
MNRMTPWVRLPTDWIQDGDGLKQFRARDGGLSTNIAALMVLVALAHSTDQETGLAKATYDTLQEATSRSRAIVSAGLKQLERFNVIERRGQSTYALVGYNRERGWGKLPWKDLCIRGAIEPFRRFNMRLGVELHALKIYLLLVARRNNKTNQVDLSYDKIASYTGIPRRSISNAISLLTALGLIHMRTVESTITPNAVAHAYRIAHIDTYNHPGTTGRGALGEGLHFEDV